jgi:ERO1-like protein beta
VYDLLPRQLTRQINALPGCYSRDSDYCFFDDMTGTFIPIHAYSALIWIPEGDYVDLRQNPETFTGYSGPSARRVWSSIYTDNCFGISEATIMKNPPAPAPPSFSPEFSLAAPGLGLTPPKRSEDPSGQCLEKQVYYKIISGNYTPLSG